MSKLSLLIRSAAATRNSYSSPVWASLRRSARPFSVEASGSDGANGDVDSKETSETATNSSAGSGAIFARLTGFRGGSDVMKHAMKSDVIHFFDGTGLSNDDVKFDYNRAYYLTGAWLKFPSRDAYQEAGRLNQRKGALYKLEKFASMTESEWELRSSYDGKFALLQGIPHTAILEDIERFLSGTNFDPNSIKTFLRGPERERVIVAQFATHADAMNAYRLKNRGFCLNNAVNIRVLH